MSSLTRIPPNPIVDNPLADLVAKAPVEAPQRFRDWPGPVARWQWAIEVGKALDLSAMQMSILQHVCMRAGRRPDGKAPGCYQAAENIGIETRYSRKHVGLALAALVKKGLLEKTGRSHDTNIFRPTFREVNVTQRHIGMGHSVTLTGNKPEGVWVQDKEVTYGTRVRGADSPIVDNDESCGFEGCPPPDQPCPVCGLAGV